jgi:membrane complex biogenesis BtpA family protein
MPLLLGAVHLLPSPSRAGCASVEAVLAAALRDARAYADGGADGLIVENLGDAPFHRGTPDDRVPPDVPALLAVAARAVRDATGLPVGINCLRNDARAALGAAAVAGARWVRVNVLAGAYVTDQGIVTGDAAALAQYRRALDWRGELLADLLVKHATPLAPLDPVVAARDLAERSGADGILLSGARTGAPVDPEMLRRVKAAVGTFPVWIGSGLSPANARDLAPLCAGAICGTALKHGGELRAAVDPRRVAELRARW